MKVLSGTQIQEALNASQIICHPFKPSHLGSAGLDLTLGYYVYRIEKMNDRTIYNPFDKEDVERYFDGPYQAMPHEQWGNLNGFKPVTNIPLDHPVISLKPGERILAHTHEFVGMKAPGVYHLTPRSDWGRNGIGVRCNTGLIEPGTINRLTIEICNLNDRETVLLPVGERIVQAVFVESSEPATNNTMKSDLETVIKTWSPDMMLPTAYKDGRELPQKIEGLSYE